MFRSQRIIFREYVCTSLKLLNYLKTLKLKSCGTVRQSNVQHHRILNSVFF